jgi:carboxymethylenebutenolidase
MCHPEAPNAVGQGVVVDDVLIPTSSAESMPAAFARCGGPGPAVLVIPDFFGRSPFYVDVARRLAIAGLNAVVPDLFFRIGPLAEQSFEAAFGRMSKLDQKLSVEDLSSAVDWLRTQGNVQGTRAGTIGFCLGGTLALLLAAQRDDLASVCFYGFPRGTPGHEDAPKPLDHADKMSGPMLGFWGEEDAHVDMADVKELERELRGRGTDFDCTIYPGLGHGFLGAWAFEDSSPHALSARGAWARTKDFLKEATV